MDSGETLRLTVAGVAIALPCAIVATRFAAQMLHGLSPADPLTLAAVEGALIGLGTIAGYWPAQDCEVRRISARSRPFPGVQWRREQSAPAFTAGRGPEYFTETKCAPCGALSMLNDELTPASCGRLRNGSN
jgi:hypothetical protein